MLAQFHDSALKMLAMLGFQGTLISAIVFWFALIMLPGIVKVMRNKHNGRI